MTPAGAIIEGFRATFARLDKLEPHEREEIIRNIVATVRAYAPESVSPLGVLPPPTEPIRDPRLRGGGYG